MEIESPQEIMKLWMPITKNHEGVFSGILSDTSIDRDNEYMSKDLIQKWAKAGSLPALANHDNKMQSWVGGWSNLRVVEKGKHMALVAEPKFFSKEANPLADNIKKQIEEAIAMGLNAGISISAIPKKHQMVEGKRMWTEAELLEATFVPIQSNRNATYGHIAKDFDIGSEVYKEITTNKNPIDTIKTNSEVNLMTEEIKAVEKTINIDEISKQVQAQVMKELTSKEFVENLSKQLLSSFDAELKARKPAEVVAEKKDAQVERNAVLKSVTDGQELVKAEEVKAESKSQGTKTVSDFLFKQHGVKSQ